MEEITFMPLLLYSKGRRLHYPLNRGLGGPKNQSESFGETLAPAWNLPRFLACLASCLIPIMSPPARLSILL